MRQNQKKIKELCSIIEQHNRAHSLDVYQQGNQVYMAYADVPHFLSNEFDVAAVQIALTMFPMRSNHNQNEGHVAVLTGEAYFLSRLPELSRYVDCVLMADIQPIIHQHNEYMLTCMLNADNRDAFMKAYIDENKNPILLAKYRSQNMMAIGTDGKIVGLENDNGVLIDAAMLKASIEAGPRGALTEHHFLASEKRYQQCRAAAKTLRIQSIHLDWTNQDDMKALMKNIDHLDIDFPFVHISNVQDYDANCAARHVVHTDQPVKFKYNVLECLKILTAKTRAPIVNYSLYQSRGDYPRLFSYLNGGTEGMLKEYREYEQLINRRDTSSPYFLANEMRSNPSRFQSKASSHPHALSDQYTNSFAEVAERVDLSNPILPQTAVMHLNNYISLECETAARFVAYFRQDDNSRVDALMAIREEESSKVLLLLKGEGFEMSRVQLPNLYDLIFIRGMNEIKNDSRVGQLLSKKEYCYYMDHNLETFAQFHRVVATLNTKSFYSDYNNFPINAKLDITSLISKFKALPGYGRDQENIVILFMKVISHLHSHGGEISHENALPENYYPQRTRSAIANVPLYVIANTILSRFYHHLTHPKFVKEVEASKDSYIVKDPECQRAQFKDFMTCFRKIQSVMTGDDNLPACHWKILITNGVTNAQSIEQFTQREQAVTIARNLKSNGINAALMRESQAGTGVNHYRVLIRDLEALELNLGVGMAKGKRVAGV